MQSLKSLLNRGKDQVGAIYVAILSWLKRRNITADRVFDTLTAIALVSAGIALLVLIWLYVRPIPTANIKVPVATDQSSYAPGEDISGIFFGDTYYTGEVRVLREVFCKDYKGIIKPPAGASVGDFFTTQGRPRHLEGQSVMVGNLPSDIPVGLNCVLQFTNVYDIQTPFGLRRIEYQYYTQNFAIVTKERRQQLECEASGRKDCNYLNSDNPNDTKQATELPATQSSPETQPVIVQPQSTTNNSTTYNNTTVNPQQSSEPAPRYVERCSVDFIVRINCRQVEVQ